MTKIPGAAGEGMDRIWPAQTGPDWTGTAGRSRTGPGGDGIPSILNRYLDFCLPPGWSKKLSNRTLPLKIGFSRPGTPRNRFVLKFCVGWYFQNRFSLENGLKSTTSGFLVCSWIIGFWLVLISVGTICLSTSVRVTRTQDLRYPPYY